MPKPSRAILKRIETKRKARDYQYRLRCGEIADLVHQARAEGHSVEAIAPALGYGTRPPVYAFMREHG